jgi:midasin
VLTDVLVVIFQVEHHCFQRQLAEPALIRGSDAVCVGREILKRTRTHALSLRRSVASKFSFTRPALVLMERIAVAVANNESVLLVGETGTGKTSAVQYLAEMMCKFMMYIQ